MNISQETLSKKVNGHIHTILKPSETRIYFYDDFDDDVAAAADVTNEY